MDLEKEIDKLKADVKAVNDFLTLVKIVIHSQGQMIEMMADALEAEGIMPDTGDIRKGVKKTVKN